IGPGTHVNAIGADGPGKQELAAEILANAKVVIDDVEQASHSGEVNVPLHDHELSAEQLHGTLGAVVAGSIAGREGDEVTVFDSTGLAVQDVAVARRIVELARERGVGTSFDFRA
ncbi:MAG: ornithine cyclodeaminase family protein, partial [Deltaproteobacteria bacterium]|nr:ornithine cyclodeaminase family protein [Deltaproteobacteria bacterium]